MILKQSRRIMAINSELQLWYQKPLANITFSSRLPSYSFLIKSFFWESTSNDSLAGIR